MMYDELLATFKAEGRVGSVYASFNAPRYSIFIDLFGLKGIIRLDIISATINLLPYVKLDRFRKVIDSFRQSIQLVNLITKKL